MKNQTPRVLYISHGGGPLPLLGDKGHIDMVRHLEQLALKIGKPSAILVISAHWEADIITITAGAAPELIYDYYGFSEEAYRIKYPCPGEPGLAGQVEQLLNRAGIENRMDGQHGFDHGLFIPLKIMYPEADIPSVQVSLRKGLNPAEHIRLGAALSDIDYNNLLIIGSGFSFHNMKAFFETETGESKRKNEEFEQWLIQTCSDRKINEDQRTERLKNWEEAPHARYCHPREEHLLPLHVCYGAAQTACGEYIELTILNKKSSLYLW